MQKTHQEKVTHTKETQRETKQGGHIQKRKEIIIIRDGLESNQTEAPAHLTPIGAFVASLELQSVGVLVDAAEVGDVVADVEAAADRCGAQSRAILRHLHSRPMQSASARGHPTPLRIPSSWSSSS